MRFYHMADIHLGAQPDRERPFSEQRRQEIWDTFRSVIRRAGQEKPDCLFICGDLFHRQPLKRELREVDYLFSRIPDTAVFLMAGNHDYLKSNSAYDSFSWSPNVFFFRSETVTAVHLERLNLTVYGNSYWDSRIREPLYDDFRPEEGTEQGIRVLMTHGGDAEHIPMNYRKIRSRGFDYVAMGHIHRPGIYEDGAPYRSRGAMAYAGALEPLDVNDTGPHGYMEGRITFEEQPGAYRTEVCFVPAARRSYISLPVELHENMASIELEERIRQMMKEKGEENLFRIILKGYRDPAFHPDRERLLSLGNVVEAKDESRPAYDYEQLKQMYRGQLIGRFLESYGDGTLTREQELGRRFGLEALLETAGGKG